MQMWAKNFTSYLFFRSEYFHIFRGKRDNYFLPIPSRNRWKTYEKCESINDPVGRSPISNCPPGVFLEGRKFDGGESYWISIRPLFIQILIAVNTYSIPKNCVPPRIRIVERVWQSSDLLLFGKSFSSWYLEMERNLVTVSSLSFFFSFSFLVSKFCRNWQVFTFRRPFFKIVDPCKRILVGLTFRSSFNYEISRIFSKTVGELFFILPPIPAEIATFSFSSLVYALVTFQLSVKFLSPLLFLLLFPRATDRKNTSPPLVNQIQPLFELDPSLFSFFQGTR